MSDRPFTRRLGAILGPAEPELTCEECFDRLDRYVEVELSTGAADAAEAAVPGMRAHLEGCPACAADRDSLRGLLGDQHWRPAHPSG